MDASLRDAIDVLHSPHVRSGRAIHLFHEHGPADTFRDRRAQQNRSRYQKFYRRAKLQRNERARIELMRRAVTDCH